ERHALPRLEIDEANLTAWIDQAIALVVRTVPVDRVAAIGEAQGLDRHAGAALGLATVDAQGQLGAIAATREVDDDVDGQRVLAGLDERKHQLVGQLVHDTPTRD